MHDESRNAALTLANRGTPVNGKRTRRTKAEMAVLRETIIDYLEVQRPASARNLFYKLVQDGLVGKDEKAYKNLIKLLVRMRRSGEIPYSYLTDASRTGYHVPIWRDPYDWIIEACSSYRWDMWAPIAERCEIWCESAAMLSVLHAIHRRYAVSLYPCRGFSSVSFAYEAATEAKRINPTELIIIYVGDYDYDGRNIDRALMAELRLHVGGQFPVVQRRVAVNLEQIATYNLPTRPDRKGAPSVQAEALEPNLVRRLVSDVIEEYLPADALAKAEMETQAGRETIFRAAKHSGGFPEITV